MVRRRVATSGTISDLAVGKFVEVNGTLSADSTGLQATFASRSEVIEPIGEFAVGPNAVCARSP